MKNVILVIVVLNVFISTCSSGPLIAKKPVNSKSDNSANKKNATIKEEPSGVTDEEKKFLKEIEAQYNIQNDEEDDGEKDVNLKGPSQPSFPAVIAFEIVNDNTTDGKGKRTIDANLGYGYKTDTGYIYSRFNSPGSKGKFMIYPYSQQDIPPFSSKSPPKYYTQTLFNKPKGERTLVEIQPSRAYQLVPINSHEHESPNTYKLDGTVSHIRTKYEHVQAVETPPPPQYSTNEFPHPTTLYSTYNGGQLSGLSGHFPMVMPNYYVSPSQFLNHPQYQGLGLNHGEHIPQRPIIPVIIIRIPSSQIQNPTAELFPKLPRNNPYSLSLNNLDLQSIVSQYLSNIQPHYESPQPPPPTPKYVLRYNQPYTYYDPHQSIYTMPKLKYPIPSAPTYIGSSQPQYLHQATTEGHQSIRYVIPHGSSAPDSQPPISHMTLSQVYGPQTVPHTTYETTDEDTLPFSENYPDSDHTRVIYTPQYQHPTAAAVQATQEQTITYATDPSSTSTQDKLTPTAAEQTNDVEDEEGEAPAPTKLTPQGPYNYHAHPYPKRQVTTSNEETKKSRNSRKLVMGIHTSV